LDGEPDTWLTLPKRVNAETNPKACVVQIYPTGPGMGSCYTLLDTALTFGRDRDCEVSLADHSVSRRHARIQPGPEGHYLLDLQSLNGSFVNDVPCTGQRLADGDYIRVGNCIFRYLTGGNVEAEYHEEIYRLTIIDALTGIHNKRYMLEFLERELARSARHQRPLSFVLFDLDRFKSVNDSLGHLGGDTTLRELVSCIKGAIRREELFCRYGGEEFAIVLPETELHDAVRVAERIRRQVERHPFRFEEVTYQTTISLGVVTTRGEEGLTPVDLIRQADHYLYRAKSDGRNCVRGGAVHPD
jgi:diguanylate cyclase (GGDEF)-like protein